MFDYYLNSSPLGVARSIVVLVIKIGMKKNCCSSRVVFKIIKNYISAPFP